MLLLKLGPNWRKIKEDGRESKAWLKLSPNLRKVSEGGSDEIGKNVISISRNSRRAGNDESGWWYSPKNDMCLTEGGSEFSGRL